MALGAIGTGWADFIALWEVRRDILKMRSGSRTFTRRLLHSPQPWRDFRCGRRSAMSCSLRHNQEMRLLVGMEEVGFTGQLDRQQD